MDFRFKNNPEETAVALTNPGVNKLEIKSASTKYYHNNFLNFEPFSSFDEDTVFVKNTRLRIVKSTSDSFEVKVVKMANGSTRAEAEANATGIVYNINQLDTILALQKGIAITKDQLTSVPERVVVITPIVDGDGNRAAATVNGPSIKLTLKQIQYLPG